MANLRLLLVVLLLHLLISISIMAASMAFNYSDALDKSLMFFEAQRSGKLPSTQRVHWRGDSCLNDGFSQQVDLVGGYYDAGDHVKFGLPMAFSVTLLSWAAVDYRAEIVEANQMGRTLEAIRWGTDYFLKAHSGSNVLWAQVGDGEADHSCWQRAEDLTTARKAYKIDSSNPGSDLAGETAAALAAASLAFQPYNSSYSSLLLIHAKQLFSFADNYRGQYDDSIPDAEKLYPSSGYSDELLWAAGWLYRATNNHYYLQYTVDYAIDLGGTGNAVRIFSWDNKYAGLQILLSKVLLDGDGESYASTLKQYKAKADFFACAYMRKNNGYNVPFTPGGLAYLLPSNNLQYAASASFVLTVYSDYLARTNAMVECAEGQVQPSELLQFSKSQADYILGQNPESMSYLVGFGTKYPKRAHHRGSSIPSIFFLHDKVDCVQGFESWYKRSEPNPNVLYGALIGGPDSSDSFTDDRDNYEQNEPTTTAAAPLIGLFSKMLSAFSSAITSVSSALLTGYSTSNQPPTSPKPQKTSAPKESSVHPKSPPLPKKPAQEDHNPPPASIQPVGSPPEESPAEQNSSSPHTSSPDHPQGAPAPSPIPGDYVYTQLLSSAAQKPPVQYLLLSALFLISASANL
ncbi:hypothetical protein Cgig2_015406 [Carnegiea gigantea]|uniref:Endoglucanase n=1 Tax=Carnegiea gigantea TaxID=171969 RepID=A0A9Q1K1R0_9CARY|nr:hypothetical protein Cgig2_015406 [Carnegiea gigantea]